ncbi:MAG: hypothetical protein ACTS3F_01850 [Phycisphaerales bacterium]
MRALRHGSAGGSARGRGMVLARTVGGVVVGLGVTLGLVVGLSRWEEPSSASSGSGAVGLEGVLGGEGAGEVLDACVGRRVTIYFRRDALGAASPNGIGALVDNMNGASLSVRGVMRGLDDEWVRLERTRFVGSGGEGTGGGSTLREDLFIPRDVVLVIRVEGE